MFRHTKKLVLTTAAALMLSGGLAATAEAGWGPAGLGANLHRRHVMKQAVKRQRRGLPVRNSAIVWLSGPRGVVYRSR